MKKYLVCILCLVMIISIAVTASAASDSTKPISKTLTSTSTYINALADSTYAIKPSSSSYWNAPFNGASDSQRAVVRVYKHKSNGIVVSSTWVYTGYSPTGHPYKTNYGQSYHYNAFLGAKVDDRDVGPITISGTFNADYQ